MLRGHTYLKATETARLWSPEYRRCKLDRTAPEELTLGVILFSGQPQDKDQVTSQDAWVGILGTLVDPGCLGLNPRSIPWGCRLPIPSKYSSLFSFPVDVQGSMDDIGRFTTDRDGAGGEHEGT